MDYYQRYIETSLECDRLRAKIEELEADRDRAWTHYAECAGTPLMADVMGERDTLRARVAELERELLAYKGDNTLLRQEVMSLRHSEPELNRE